MVSDAVSRLLATMEDRPQFEALAVDHVAIEGPYIEPEMRRLCLRDRVTRFPVPQETTMNWLMAALHLAMAIAYVLEALRH